MNKMFFTAIGFLTIAAAAAEEEPAADALAKAEAILEAAPIIDGHNDLPWVIREGFASDILAYDVTQVSERDTDLPRLREGHVGAQFWSVYVPSGLSGEEAIRTQLEQIDLARRLIETYPDDFALALGADDIERLQKDGDVIASLLGMEGGHTIANSLGVLRSYFDLGVRYMTLTHLHSSDWADSATDEARHGGLSSFGEDVVREMNRLGMLVDIAHVSVDTMSDVLDISEAPVIFSHGGADVVTSHPRNAPDSILVRLKENGGVMMVCFIPSFLSQPASRWADGLIPKLKDANSQQDFKAVFDAYVRDNGPSPRATISDVADHIEHVARVAGVDHVGIGADFYGAQSDLEKVEGLEDVSRYPYLFAELIERGWSEEDLQKLARGNILRVLREAEQVAQSMQAR